MTNKTLKAVTRIARLAYIGKPLFCHSPQCYSSLHWLDFPFLYAILVQWSIFPTFYPIPSPLSQSNILHWSKNNFLRAETGQWRLLLSLLVKDGPGKSIHPWLVLHCRDSSTLKTLKPKNPVLVFHWYIVSIIYSIVCILLSNDW